VPAPAAGDVCPDVPREDLQQETRVMPSTSAALPLSVPQYLFDDAWIAEARGVVRRWLPASVNPDPVLRPDKPWEGRALVLYGSVLPDSASGYRMYYSCFRPGEGHAAMMLATSPDGLHWEKPELGLVEYQGRRGTNLMTPPERPFDSPSVIFDAADPQFPYKMACYQSDPASPSPPESGGMYAWRSHDGLRWQVIPGRRSRLGDRSSLYLDPHDGRYVFLSRDPHKFAVAGGRHISRTDSADFITWSEPELILARDMDDEPDVQFYGMPVFHRHGWYLGLLEYWDSARDIIEVHLAVSRDGRRWQRPLPRRPFIAATYDWNRQWSTCANNGPVILREQMVFHFGGRWVAHGWDTVRQHGVIGIASLPLDRFCAIEGGVGGQFVTPPFVWPGGRLEVNADTRESFDSHPAHCNGEIMVEALDADGAPLPEWSGSEAAVFRGNTHCRGGIWPAEVRWPGERSLSSLTGRALRLRFHLRHARLFTVAAAAHG